MSQYTNRLNKLEAAIVPPTITVYRFSSAIHYDDQGQCAELIVYAKDSALLGRFPAQAGESTEDLCARAYAAVGRQPDDGVIERHLIRAGPNGGMAPGFERFAKHA
jgi:hypothetical protein